MGVLLSGPVPIIRPEERAEHVEIPGRSGDLTELEGEQVYNSYIQTAGIMVRGGYRVRDIFNWLKGSGYVTFHGEPDRRQEARIIGAITLNKHSRNSDWWEGECQFYCQPLKEPLTYDLVTITSSGSNVQNRGDVISRPIITAKANATSMTVTAGGKSITITGLTSGNEYIIDSDVMEVTDVARETMLTKNSTGSFPVLNPGANSVTGSGWSKLIIDREERYL